ncbi:methyltransferase domain-containing protein [Candidatus Dependentiae bacterium]|nr:methyltransferase domain-containing protein [Candidatus Dependentiae bacterium]
MEKNEHSPFKLDLLQKYLAGSRVLDLGAGRLKYSYWMKKHFPEMQITAVDLFEQVPEHGVEYVIANLEQELPFSHELFSSVVAFDLIEHIFNEELFVAEIFRVLQNGGILIGSVPHDEDLFLPEYNLTFYHRSDVTHKRYYTKKTLHDCLRAAGFTGIVVWPEGGVSPHVFAEFFPRSLRWIIKKIISFLRLIGLISVDRLKSDLFFIAVKKVEKEYEGASV